MKNIAVFAITAALSFSAYAQAPSAEDINKSVAEEDKAKIAMMKNDLETAYVHMKNAAQLDPTNSTFFNSVAYLAMKNGEPEKAIEFLENAKKLDQDSFGEGHPNVAAVINNMASVYSSMGNHDKAVEHYQQAYDMVAAALGEKHPQAENIKNLLENEKAK
ncbi:tetratricopeptide repeat protein [Pseudemcibacter aquimaris]|uniref:tetratricopeptide repeat protein n=1 Tax=Pseudemcibacter aquimaris TaxID=2857064 RepID=UPI002012E3E6|nr:tetratricopeptide repeat protein [Pseudemcibacter aquimaris]MCC3859952.1 tetratricopeptide repeat protein [Pseudemcibacter aquimaris]WDU57284.1 tetratricopeptide repeat protein [Pseudemcibacter aquimaris]